MARPDVLHMYLGFLARAHDRSNLVDWVDAEVMARDVVRGPLLELASLRDKSDADIEATLLLVAEEQHGAAMPSRAWATLGAMVGSGALAGYIACQLLGRLPRAWLGDVDDLELCRIEHDFQVGSCGNWRSLQEAEAQVRAFTDYMTRRLSTATE